MEQLARNDYIIVRQISVKAIRIVADSNFFLASMDHNRLPNCCLYFS